MQRLITILGRVPKALLHAVPERFRYFCEREGLAPCFYKPLAPLAGR